MTDDDNVTKLPVRFKSPLADERTLMHPWEVHKSGVCSHMFVQYIVDPSLAEVECGRCGAKLNPMWVLSHLAVQDRRFQDAAERYREETKRISERQRTKCQHCGKMTRISHN